MFHDAYTLVNDNVHGALLMYCKGAHEIKFYYLPDQQTSPSLAQCTHSSLHELYLLFFGSFLLELVKDILSPDRLEIGLWRCWAGGGGGGGVRTVGRQRGQQHGKFPTQANRFSTFRIQQCFPPTITGKRKLNGAAAVPRARSSVFATLQWIFWGPVKTPDMNNDLLFYIIQS